MDPFADLGNLQTQQWQQLEDLADRFAKSWQNVDVQGEPPNLGDFLPSHGDELRPVALIELIKTDLEIRGRRGLTVLLEDYVARFPELGSAESVPVQLIYEEYRVRHLFSDKPRLLSYQSRFPKQFAVLQQLLDTQPLPTVGGATPTPPSAVPVAPASAAPQPPGVFHPSSGGVLSGGGGYKWLKRIGSGGFGEVWQAEAPGGIPVAIKVIFRPLDHDEAQRELQALELIKRLSHTFLLQTQAYWSEQDRLVIVMELADGSLRDRLKECRKEALAGIPAAELVGYFREAAEALDYLHSEHVLHRDIKPDNILLLKRHAKLADFGLARLHESQRSVEASGSGTPAYMAPEVWRGRVSERSDQYSLAVTYAELRLDRRLFTSSDMMALMLEHMQEPPDLRPLSEAEQRVLLRALSKEPSERFTTCREFVQVLEQAIQTGAAQVSPSKAPTAPLADSATSSATLKQELYTSETMVRHAPAIPATPAWRPAARTTTKPEKAKKPARFGVALVGVVAVGIVGALLVRQLVQDPATSSGSIQLIEPPAITVRAGERKPFTIQIQRDKFEGPVNVTFKNTPAHVKIPESTIPSNAPGIPVAIVASEEAVPGTSKVTIVAQASGQYHEVPFSLTVEPVEVFFPPALPNIYEWEKETGARLEIISGKKHYNRIACVFKHDGTRVVFVLIPKAGAQDPDTFYLMENKVWVRLFHRFAEMRPDLVKNSEWRKGGLAKRIDTDNSDPLHPVLRVHVDDAWRLARWLGGDLPTTKQWDKASGAFEENAGDGPYIEPWNENAPGEIAVNRGLEGPMKVGAAPRDKSRFEIKDMAGNGREWTRDLFDVRNGTVPVSNPRDELVFLRGQSYQATEPWKFRYLTTRKVETKPYQKPWPDIGFRVVLEPPLE